MSPFKRNPTRKNKTSDQTIEVKVAPEQINTENTAKGSPSKPKESKEKVKAKEICKRALPIVGAFVAGVICGGVAVAVKVASEV